MPLNTSSIMGLFGGGQSKDTYQPKGGNRKNTPNTYGQGFDAFREQGGAVYPLNTETKGATHQGIVNDESPAHESLTIQGQAGSFVQLRHDGSVQIVAQDSMYTLTFGTNRVMITGAHDVTVQGEGSLCVEGDYNCTVRGDANFAIQGNMNITSKQFNVLAGGGCDIAAKMVSVRSESGMELSAEGNIHNNAKGSIAQVARGGNFSVRAGQDVQMAAGGSGALTAQGGQLDFLAAMDVNVDGANVFINSGKAKPASHRSLGSVVPPIAPSIGKLF